MRIGVVLLLAASTASAMPGPDVNDGIDDEPLARDLRSAFGATVMPCSGDECHLDLGAVTCVPDKHCRAIDHLARDRSVTGISADLADHMSAIGAATWSIRCSSRRSDVSKLRHGHCQVQVEDGDDVLSEALLPLGNSKLGGSAWTGTLLVKCTADGCAVRCDTSDSRCVLPAETTITSAALAKVVRRRAGGNRASIDCQRWRDEVNDGGLVDALGCSVTP